MFLRRLISRAGLFLLAAPTLAGVNQWTLLGPYGPVGPLPVQAVAISAEAIYAASYSDVFRSMDGGLHWDSVFHATSGRVWSLASRPASPRVVYAGTADGVYRSTDEGNTWFAAGLHGESVYALAVDPGDSSTLYAGTLKVLSGSIFKSTNSGMNWNRVTDVPGYVTVLAIDPNDSDIVFASGVLGGILRTRDGGLHWTHLAGEDSNIGIAIDPADSSLVYAVRVPFCPFPLCFASTLRRSNDGGDTWSDVTTLPDIFVDAVVVDPSGTVYANAGERVFVSRDHGEAWAPIGVQTPLSVTVLALDPLDPTKLYAATYGGLYVIQVDPEGPCAFPGFTLCLHGGRFEVTVGWQASPLGPTFPAAAIPVTSEAGYFWFFHPDNVEVMVKVLDGTFVNGHFWVFYGALSNVQYTVHVTDTLTGLTQTYENQAGVLASFADTSAFPGTHEASSASPTERKATPVGRSTAVAWTAIGPDPAPSVSGIVVDPRFSDLYAAAEGEGGHTVLKGNDTVAGGGWVPLVTFPDFVREIQLDFFSFDIVYAVTTTALYRSADAGGTWPEIGHGLGATSLAFDSLAAGTLYAGTPSGLFVSTDHGETWAPRGPELAGKPVGPVATTSSGKFYAVEGGQRIWTSDDSGLSWTLTHEFSTAGLQSLVASSSDPFTVYVSESCCGGVGPGSTVPEPMPVWKSEDGGSTWTEVLRTEGGANAIVLDPSDPSVLYAGGYSGVFRSANGGTSWTQINDGLPGVVLTLELRQDSTLFAGTGAGVFKLDLAGFPHSCQPDGQTLCLNDGRFRVEAAFQLSPTGPVFEAHAVSLTADTGYFWFFEDANVELVVKMLDGRFVNGHFWFFLGALSSVEYTVTVTDTQTGEVLTYHNDLGNLASVADTSAF